jgi:hypothetical protein
MKCACLNCHAGIASSFPIDSVDLRSNAILAFCPHIQCACLNCHASIAFSFPIFSTHLLFHQFRMEVRGGREAMVHGV